MNHEGDPKLQTEHSRPSQAKAQASLEEAARIARTKLRGSEAGSETSAFHLLFKLAPVNAFVAAVPVLIVILVILAGWATTVALTALAGYLVLTAFTTGVSSDPRTLSALFFLLGAFGAGFLLCLIMSSLTAFARSILRRWLRVNFDFLLGTDKGEETK